MPTPVVKPKAKVYTVKKALLARLFALKDVGLETIVAAGTFTPEQCVLLTPIHAWKEKHGLSMDKLRKTFPLIPIVEIMTLMRAPTVLETVLIEVCTDGEVPPHYWVIWPGLRDFYQGEVSELVDAYKTRLIEYDSKPGYNYVKTALKRVCRERFGMFKIQAGSWKKNTAFLTGKEKKVYDWRDKEYHD